MSKEAVDATCKVLLNFLIWATLAAMFYTARGLDLGWANNISGMFSGGIDYVPAVAIIAAVFSLAGVIAFVAKKLRAPRSHRVTRRSDRRDRISCYVFWCCLILCRSHKPMVAGSLVVPLSLRRRPFQGCNLGRRLTIHSSRRRFAPRLNSGVRRWRARLAGRSSFGSNIGKSLVGSG